jgi:hypothetical protein
MGFFVASSGGCRVRRPAVSDIHIPQVDVVIDHPHQLKGFVDWYAKVVERSRRNPRCNQTPIADRILYFGDQFQPESTAVLE